MALGSAAFSAAEIPRERSSDPKRTGAFEPGFPLGTTAVSAIFSTTFFALVASATTSTTSPRPVPAEYDMPVPGGIDVKVETVDGCVYIAVSVPPVGHGESPGHDLSKAAGGPNLNVCRADNTPGDPCWLSETSRFSAAVIRRDESGFSV